MYAVLFFGLVTNYYLYKYLKNKRETAAAVQQGSVNQHKNKVYVDR